LKRLVLRQIIDLKVVVSAKHNRWIDLKES
jgi:hypothetical protein